MTNGTVILHLARHFQLNLLELKYSRYLSSSLSSFLPIEPTGIEMQYLDAENYYQASSNWTYWNWNPALSSSSGFPSLLPIEPTGIEMVQKYTGDSAAGLPIEPTGIEMGYCHVHSECGEYFQLNLLELKLSSLAFLNFLKCFQLNLLELKLMTEGVFEVPKAASNWTYWNWNTVLTWLEKYSTETSNWTYWNWNWKADIQASSHKVLPIEPTGIEIDK